MSDLLGEALALLNNRPGAWSFLPDSKRKAVLAAARNWHALTKLIRDGEDVTLWLFDALTDTAEPEEETRFPPKRVKQPDPDMWKMDPRP